MSSPADTAPGHSLTNEQALRSGGRREQWTLLGLSLPAILVVVAIVIIQ